MVVKANINTNKPNKTVNGMAILIDLDKKIKAIKPAIKQAIAVRVPERNNPQTHANPTIRKNIRYFVILFVIPNMIKATAVEAIPIPKLAASL